MKKNIPLEKNITRSILTRLNNIPCCRAKKRFSGVMGESDLDVYGCYQGRAFFIEVKRPGQKPTPRQDAIIRDWESVGAITGCVYNADEAEALVTG